MRVALCLGGGGAKGSFQAGVLKYIADSGITIDGISGTSVGALNGALIAQKRSDDLLRIWKSLTLDQGFYTQWTFGRLEGFFRGGLFDPQPLRKIIDQYVDVSTLIESDIKFVCCSVDLISGELFYVRNEEANRGILKAAVLASASYYVGFPPVEIGEKLLTDGGAREAVPAEMMTVISPDVDRYIIITCNDGKLKLSPTPGRNALSVYARLLEIVFHELDCDDLRLGQAKYWNMSDKFVVVKPQEQLMSTLECDPDKIRRAIDLGYEAGRKTLTAAGVGRG